MCSLEHDGPNFLSDRDERSLPSIINAIKLDPRNLFALRKGKDIFWSHVLMQSSVKPRIRWSKLNRFHALGNFMNKKIII